MRRVRNQKGFTIMELMIVIVIIGILLAIAIPAYNSFRDTAERRACESNMRTILSANGLYYAEYGANAPAIGDLDAYLDNASTMECPDSAGGTYEIANGVVTCPNDHGVYPPAVVVGP